MKVQHIYTIFLVMVPVVHAMESGAFCQEKNQHGEDIQSAISTQQDDLDATSLEMVKQNDDKRPKIKFSELTLQDLPAEILTHIASFIAFPHIDSLLSTYFTLDRTLVRIKTQPSMLPFISRNIFCYKFQKENHTVHAIIFLVNHAPCNLHASYIAVAETGKVQKVYAMQEYTDILPNFPTLLAIDPSLNHIVFANQYQIYAKASVSGRKRFIENSNDNTDQLPIEKNNPVKSICTSKNPLTALAINDTGTLLAAATTEGEIIIIQLSDNKDIYHTKRSLNDTINKLQFFEEENQTVVVAHTSKQKIVVNFSLNKVRIRNYTPNVKKVFPGKICALIFKEQGQKITLATCEHSRGKKQHTLAEFKPRASLSSATISPDRQKIAYSERGDICVLINKKHIGINPSLLHERTMNNSIKPQVVSFSADSKSLYYIDRDGAIKIYELPTESCDVQKQVCQEYQYEDMRCANSIYAAALLYKINQAYQIKEKMFLHSNRSKMIFNRLPDFVKAKLLPHIIKTKPAYFT